MKKRKIALNFILASLLIITQGFAKQESQIYQAKDLVGKWIFKASALNSEANTVKLPDNYYKQTFEFDDTNNVTYVNIRGQKLTHKYTLKNNRLQFDDFSRFDAMIKRIDGNKMIWEIKAGSDSIYYHLEK